MSYPSLLLLKDLDEYKKYWIKNYCQQGIKTFDGIVVFFRQQDFEHAFYESVNQRDDTFSVKRAERIGWIAAALKDPKSQLYIGWDNRKKCYDNQRRVTIVMGNYVVVIAISKKMPKQARFITAFVADTPSRPGRPSTIEQIKRSPKWEKKNR